MGLQLRPSEICKSQQNVDFPLFKRTGWKYSKFSQNPIQSMMDATLQQLMGVPSCFFLVNVLLKRDRTVTLLQTLLVIGMCFIKSFCVVRDQKLWNPLQWEQCYCLSAPTPQNTHHHLAREEEEVPLDFNEDLLLQPTWHEEIFQHKVRRMTVTMSRTALPRSRK